MKLKLRSTTPQFKKLAAKTILVVTAAVMALAVPVHVYADRFDDQINALQGEISGYQAEAARLRSERPAPV